MACAWALHRKVFECICCRRYFFSWNDGGRRKLLDTQILGNAKVKMLSRRAANHQNAGKTSSAECDAHKRQENPDKNDWIDKDRVMMALVVTIRLLLQFQCLVVWRANKFFFLDWREERSYSLRCTAGEAPKYGRTSTHLVLNGDWSTTFATVIMLFYDNVYLETLYLMSSELVSSLCMSTILLWFFLSVWFGR